MASTQQSLNRLTSVSFGDYTLGVPDDITDSLYVVAIKCVKVFNCSRGKYQLIECIANNSMFYALIRSKAFTKYPCSFILTDVKRVEDMAILYSRENVEMVEEKTVVNEEVKNTFERMNDEFINYVEMNLQKIVRMK